MKTDKKTLITVQAEIKASVEKVWKCWTKPEHIIHWNFASDDWHAPWAKNDLRKGGKFSWRMEAKDGSFGFDFEGEYTIVKPYNYIEELLGDGRVVKINFEKKEDKIVITETFEAESQNQVEMQKNGWQAILNNFKKYAETPARLETIHFEILINATPRTVYSRMLDKKFFNEWNSVFNPSSNFEGSWLKGSKIRFIGTDKDGKTGGMVSKIEENIPNKFVSILHLGIIMNGEEITEGHEVDDWAGAHENYTFENHDGNTLLKIDLDSNQMFKTYFSETYPKALEQLKSICEQ
jgi:uncharacterized protein YndB with AHSA1/START domain